MDWQLPIVGILVISALFYLSRRMLRAWRGHGAGCGGCKCPTSANSSKEGPMVTRIPVEQVRLRRR